MGVAAMSEIAALIDRTLTTPDDDGRDAALAGIRADVKTLADQFPLYR
jgi:glycine/serine hydroxymethyltransferase